MQRALAVAALIILCGAACSAVKKAPMDPRLVEAQEALDGAQSLKEAGEYPKAVLLGEYALELWESIHGDTHPEVANCLNLLGDTHRLRGDYTQAEPLLQRALAIREAVFGKHHPDVAQSLSNLANLFAQRGLYARAEPLHARALAILEAALGERHPYVAGALNNFASFYLAQGLYTRAEPLYQRALAIREAVFGKHHRTVAEPLNNLAVLYHHQGLYARAEPLYERALAIRQAALGEDHPSVAESLISLGALYTARGLYARAEPLHKRALAIREEALGEDHPDVAQSLSQLANLYMAQGRYARAGPLHERALAIYEAALGENHPYVAASLNNLARLYAAQRLDARAEPLYERSIAIREAAFGKHHLTVAEPLNNLALLYAEQGDYARAGPLYERAIELYEKAFGEDHLQLAGPLNNLANLYAAHERYALAEPLYEHVLEIFETSLGENHPQVAAALNNLAILYELQGLYARAEPLYGRALAIRKAALGEDHPDVAQSLHNIALLYMAQGLFARAEPLYERALAIHEAALGKKHPLVAVSLDHLAQLRLTQRNLPEALPLFTRAFTVSEEHLRQEVLGFSEARLARALHLLRAQEDRLYTLVRAYPNEAGILRLALSAALLRKGRSVEELTEASRIIYRGLDPADRETFERLRGLRTELTTLAFSGPGGLSPADYQQRLKELTAQGDVLETNLARRSAPLRALSTLPPPAEIIDRVATALPPDGALVEFVTYRDTPLVHEPGAAASQRPGHLRYLALLLFADGRARSVDLGPVEAIDAAVLRLHDALARRAVSYRPAAQALHALAFRPLLPQLGQVRRLFLSPDGQLALVPFSALHDSNSFLVESWDITYLTSGKDLLPRPEGIAPARSVVVMADPAFGSSPATPLPAAPAAPALAERPASLVRFFSSLRADLADQSWPPLPGSRKEAETIQGLLPQAQLLLGPAATKHALLTLETPGVLHIATHGFFLEDAAAPTATRAVGHFGAVGDAGPSQRPPDPLLRSGLVLARSSASAAPSAPSHEDSFVTALELAGLNLWGTQLVVLSACDTGRGDIQLGQGVYGLRRALGIAGAETLVTSLWKVNDEVTHQLMEAYYRNLMAGQGRTAALRQAMRALRHRHPHPHFWAPFLAIGKDGPLQGLVGSSVNRTRRLELRARW